MKNNSSLKKIVILVCVLALPGFLYYLLQEKGKNRYRPLSIYGPKQVASTFHTKRGKQIPDTIYHQVQSFKLRDQEGKNIGLPADTAQITIVNFFYTRCSDCLAAMNEVGRVVGNYKGNRLVKFYSITLDPTNDTQSVLAEYAKSKGINSGKWSLLTGSQDSIFKLSRQGFLVDAHVDSTGNIVHNPAMILVDPNRRIRGYYDTGSKEAVDKLIDEVKVQIAEELRQVADF